jgi:putative aldouronate transport system substrate-binding protein
LKSIGGILPQLHRLRQAGDRGRAHAHPSRHYDPTRGLFTPFLAANAAPLSQLILDRLTDIVLGRRALSEYDEIVKDWQAQGGNQLRPELEQVIASASA